MNRPIPEFCLVVLIGASGSGKSTFARRHFSATEVVSSDHCRALVADDENDQSATGDAFEVAHFIIAKRLAARRLTVVDASNVRREDRGRLVALAREYHALPVAFIFNLPEKLCLERNAARADRDFGPHVVRNQTRSLRQSLRGIRREGFRYDYRLDTAEAVDAVVIERQRLWTDKRDDSGPFDIIGDVHGCADELHMLVRKLGYTVTDTDGRYSAVHPAGRRLIFIGDLVDRGPDSPDVLRFAMDTVSAGQALCIAGNHENKLLRKLRGRNVQLTHGLAETVEQLERTEDAFRERVATFIDSLISHYVLDNGKLAVAHAGMPEAMQGRSSGAVRAFSLYGETSGETDEYGLPVRYNWADEYRGRALVVYGHTPVPRAEWLNNTICLDTGCVFGGELTALRYPEKELVSVPAARVYFAPVRPLAPVPDDARISQQAHDDLLHIDDERENTPTDF